MQTAALGRVIDSDYVYRFLLTKSANLMDFSFLVFDDIVKR
jgi:hypothetical protein